jgi:hypothetical protein
MTHARKPPTLPPLGTFELPWLKPPYLMPPPALPAVAPDPEELILLRQCADEAGLPHVCPETACAKARRCRARRRPVAHRPHFSYPPCLATVWEDIYAPYARYRAYCSWLVDLDAKLRAGAGDGGQERSTPDGRLKR